LSGIPFATYWSIVRGEPPADGCRSVAPHVLGQEATTVPPQRAGGAIHDTAEDPLRETRHDFKNCVSVISGWWQLIVREDGKLAADSVRRARFVAQLEASIRDLSDAIERQLGGIGSDRDTEC
jgi:hypothetical protein